MLKSIKTGVSTSKRVFLRVFTVYVASQAMSFSVCSLGLASLRFALKISKTAKELSHAQCQVTHRIRIFDKISEHVKMAKSAVPEGAVTIVVAKYIVEEAYLLRELRAATF